MVFTEISFLVSKLFNFYTIPNFNDNFIVETCVFKPLIKLQCLDIYEI